MNNSLKYFFVFLKPYFVQELLLLFLLISTTATNLVTPYFLKLIIDDEIPFGHYNKMLGLIGLLILIYLIRFFLNILLAYINTWISNKVVFDIKTKVFQNLLHHNIDYFETNKPGDIIQKVSGEVDKIQFFLSTSINRVLTNLFTIISLIIVLCILDFKLFLASIVVIPLSFFCNRKLKPKIRETINNNGNLEGDLYSFYFDRIKNIKLIKTFNSYTKEISLLSFKLNNLYKSYLKNAIFVSLAGNLSTLFISLGPLIVFTFGGYEVINKVLTIGSLVAFIQYLNRLYAPSNDLISLYVDYAKAQESSKKIAPILFNNKWQEEYLAKDSPSIVESIQLKDISFNIGAISIINKINYKFTKGKKYAIVGTSGSGKSTILKLIADLYCPSSGSIVINNSLELSELNHYAWINKIAYIGQDTSVLYGSIKENLLYGDQNASEEKVLEAATWAKLNSYINTIPLGLNSLIGDGDEAVWPSGGQLQQISLARIYLKQCEIIILDESTSSIDSINDAGIIEGIMDISKEKILIVVSHRLSTIRNFDEVLLIENGGLSENGKHLDLRKQGSKYYNLFKDQLELN